ncbi:glycosyltransferase [Mixta hanseatica]|uniref:Glycosyltransferase family 4 protein n=1 Tax=Mixta hanseatica TaxID=2872648 RepID=A0ABY4R533_9GAMM|nr:glycosyltransferase [Mixta hanseatica]UQY42860.1 glycosyltransferase family 4 protein [Mixta hanseatica]
MKNYDLIFITNIPAFYKVNLFNSLTCQINIKVIFISKKSSMREADFYNYDCKFDHEYIQDEDFETRDKLKVLQSVYRKLKKCNYQRLVFPGWEIKELFFLSLLSPRRKNAVVIESSILETRMTGIAGRLKKLFLTRMGAAYPSGILQKEILAHLGFSGKIYITHGVGVANPPREAHSHAHQAVSHDDLKYLYVGRLAPEKNLSLLIDVFNETGEQLIIAGSGPDTDDLQKKAKNNITFLGYINNRELENIYRQCDAFILPSLAEPWGLVVEEALSLGLPVIISDRVGCKEDLVKENGIVFKATSKDSLKKALNKMKLEYNIFYNAAQLYDLEGMYKKQINSYISSVAKNEI